MEQIIHDVYILKCLIGVMAACFLILFYAISKPFTNELPKGRRATKEEINNLFDTVDPINPEKIQEFCDYEILQHRN